MKNKIEQINYILMEWNPIEVKSDCLVTEYTEYIPILLSQTDFINLVSALEDIVQNRIGLDYMESNIEHKKDILYYAYKIYLILSDR